MDDDNEAVSEILPVPGEAILPTNHKLGWDGIGHKKKHNFTNWVS